MKSDQSGGSPRCRICDSDETICHVVIICQGMADERKRLLEQFQELCKATKNEICFQELSKSDEQLCQFILEPTSLNLHTRVSMYDPVAPEFYKLSRDFCHIIDKKRIHLIKELENISKS